jgi:AcrR family transcriptional regulator
MRVTAAVKNATRERILSAAAERFAVDGFATATTRDVAKTAGVGVGTLFNYFPTKEGMAGALVDAALVGAHEEIGAREFEQAAIEERLFALIASELRHLRKLRGLIRPLLEVATGPLDGTGQGSSSIKQNHLALLEQMLVENRPERLPSAVALQLYWTLYAGVLSFWSNDESPKQEDTLALLDETIRMFVAWLDSAPTQSEPDSARPPLDKGGT